MQLFWTESMAMVYKESIYQEKTGMYFTGFATRISEIIQYTENNAYNPITNKNTEIVLPQMGIESSTSFITPLTMAEKRISVSASTKRDLKSVLK